VRLQLSSFLLLTSVRHLSIQMSSQQPRNQSLKRYWVIKQMSMMEMTLKDWLSRTSQRVKTTTVEDSLNRRTKKTIWKCLKIMRLGQTIHSLRCKSLSRLQKIKCLTLLSMFSSWLQRSSRSWSSQWERHLERKASSWMNSKVRPMLRLSKQETS
jgi:hypothetical protein